MNSMMIVDGSVGGGSLEPFVAYFARSILMNPAVLSLNMFAVGRRYTPVNKPNSRNICYLCLKKESVRSS